MARLDVDSSARIHQSEIAPGVEIREFCTIRDSSVERDCRIYERVSIKKSSVGIGSDINAGTYIEYADIGRGVQIAPNCVIVGVTHNYSREGIGGEDVFHRIGIKDGVWVCVGSIILPGVVVGEGSVIGAGSVVKVDVPDRHLYVGTPSEYKIRPIKQ